MTLGIGLALFAVVTVTLTMLRSKTQLATVPGAADAAGQAAAGSLDRSIAKLQQRLEKVPQDWPAWAALGSAYVQQARVTADPTYYPKAQGALERSLAIETPKNFPAFTGLSSLAAARHDFAAALTWGQKAVSVNPSNAGAHAVVGDAFVELGRYPEAYAAFQRMVDLRPGLSSYARISYTWELQGNIPNAIRSLQLALQSASSASDKAFASFYLGELYWNNGQVAKAATQYAQGLRLDPTFVRSRAGLAKVEAARGQIDKAAADYQAVIDVFPLPEYVIALGDLYSSVGRSADAAREYELVDVQRRLLQANGVNIDGEIALFSADHHLRVAEGLASARAEYGRRRSIDVADTLGWSLAANKKYAEALTYANQSLRLGTKNALFLYHRGMINKALGKIADARRDLKAALATNPHFSRLWEKTAAATLRALKA